MHILCAVSYFNSLVSVLSFSTVYGQLKYHDTGRERDCLPQVGQWNMMNKVFPAIKL